MVSSPNASSSGNSAAKRDDTQDKNNSKRFQNLIQQWCEEPDDASSNHSTNKQDGAPAQSFIEEDEESKAQFSRLIDALINCQIDASEVHSDQRRHATPPNHFEENMREEALILETLAGPGATDAERKKIADDAAESRRSLAERSIESIAESVARDAEVAQALRAFKSVRRQAARYDRQIARYDRELARLQRLAGVASAEEEREQEGKIPEGTEAEVAAVVEDLTDLEKESLRPLRELHRSPAFQALLSATGSLNEAVKTLTDIVWAEGML